jgi:hypothetical protein
VTGRSVHMPEMLLERYWELGEIVARKTAGGEDAS